jgi:uncharacterized membrane protein
MRRTAICAFAVMMAATIASAPGQVPAPLPIPPPLSVPTLRSAPMPVIVTAAPAVPAAAPAAPAVPAAAAARLPRAVSRHSLRVCNHTSEQISLAISYQSGTQTVSKGWWNVDPDRCSPIFGPEDDMQYYASTGSGKRWGGSEPHCVTVSTAFEFRTVSSDSACSPGQAIRNFKIVPNGPSEAYSTNLVAQ